MEQFRIPIEYYFAIQFFNEQGHILNKESLEYLLLLFPQPQGIIFIRIDTTKIDIAPEFNTDDRLPFGISKLNNIPKTMQPIEVTGEAVPVRRQNCFIGHLPTTGSNNLSLLEQHKDRHCARELMSKMNSIHDRTQKRKNIAAKTSAVKRSLRI